MQRLPAGHTYLLALAIHSATMAATNPPETPLSLTTPGADELLTRERSATMPAYSRSICFRHAANSSRIKVYFLPTWPNLVGAILNRSEAAAEKGLPENCSQFSVIRT